MRKVFFVLFVLSLVAVGFFLGTISADNTAYARLSVVPGDSQVECFNTATGQPCEEVAPSCDGIIEANHLLLKENYKLRQELEIFRALEAFWSEEVLRRDNSLQGAWLKSISESCKDPNSYRCWGGHEKGM